CASRSHLERTMWMLVCLLSLFAAPAWYVWIVRMTPAAPRPDWLQAWSPLTGIYALTSAPGNQRPDMSRSEWIAAAAPLAPAALLWLGWSLRAAWQAHAQRRGQGGQAAAG
ncbi:MAG: hypothetical protein KDA21_01180, partial [Phycisphaerales bacterium]|nr:hypothetical protein [Phycisphaerales bacterium]